MILTTIFYHVDNFCKQFEKELNKKAIPNKNNKCNRGRKRKLILSEVITIILFFHYSKYRTFKDYYNFHVKNVIHQAFGELVSYNRFVELMKESLVPLLLFTQNYQFNEPTGISFIDSTALKVCHNKRISSNKVFKDIAKRGKTSTGWFYGFKLHFVINYQGEILSFAFTSGNTSDNNQDLVMKLVEKFKGKLFGDKGYISQELFEKLFKKGIVLITKIRKTMKNKLVDITDKLILKKRGVIESVGNILKNQCQIEHSRHRSVVNFFVNAIAALAAYFFRFKKPSMKLHAKELIEGN